MKIHTTNYYNTFIEVAGDCPVLSGIRPPATSTTPSVAKLQHDHLQAAPYSLTSDELLFLVFARRKEIPESDWEEQKRVFFSRSQACLRTSPLGKRYGWGIHFDAEGKVALFGRESEAYHRFLDDSSIRKLKAIRSRRT